MLSPQATVVEPAPPNSKVRSLIKSLSSDECAFPTVANRFAHRRIPCRPMIASVPSYRSAHPTYVKSTGRSFVTAVLNALESQDSLPGNDIFLQHEYPALLTAIHAAPTTQPSCHSGQLSQALLRGGGVGLGPWAIRAIPALRITIVPHWWLGCWVYRVANGGTEETVRTFGHWHEWHA